MAGASGSMAVHSKHFAQTRLNPVDRTGCRRAHPRGAADRGGTVSRATRASRSGPSALFVGRRRPARRRRVRAAPGARWETPRVILPTCVARRPGRGTARRSGAGRRHRAAPTRGLGAQAQSRSRAGRRVTARLAGAGTIGQLLTGQVGQRFPVVDHAAAGVRLTTRVTIGGCHTEAPGPRDTARRSPARRIARPVSPRAHSVTTRNHNTVTTGLRLRGTWGYKVAAAPGRSQGRSRATFGGAGAESARIRRIRPRRRGRLRVAQALQDATTRVLEATYGPRHPARRGYGAPRSPLPLAALSDQHHAPHRRMQTRAARGSPGHRSHAA